MLIGLVGKPSSGKSTFFRASSLAAAEIASFPFTTIKPNRGMAYIKIKDLAAEFGKKSEPREGFVKQNWRFVPFEIMDVAGLVKGASEGKGLGNQFLDDLTSADALIHVVDISGETDAEGKQTKDYDPIEDIIIIEKELDLWYFGIMEKAWDKVMRNMKVQKLDFAKTIASQFSGLKVTEDDVRSVVLKLRYDVLKPDEWIQDKLFIFARELRKHTKPMIIAANKIDRPNGKINFARVKEQFNYPIVACFADGELALKEADKAGMIEYVPGSVDFTIVRELSEKQKEALDSIKKVLKEFGSTGVQEVLNKIIFDILKYIAIYPAGSKLEDSDGRVLPDCFLMPPESTALDFAYKLHSDIGKNFIKAVDVRTKKAVGKDYKLKNGDGLEIMTK